MIWSRLAAGADVDAIERARADLAVQLPNLDASLRDLFGHLDLHLGRSLGAEALSGAGLDRLAARRDGWSANLEGLSHWTEFLSRGSQPRMEEHTTELLSQIRHPYAIFLLQNN